MLFKFSAAVALTLAVACVKSAGGDAQLAANGAVSEQLPPDQIPPGKIPPGYACRFTESSLLAKYPRLGRHDDLVLIFRGPALNWRIYSNHIGYLPNINPPGFFEMRTNENKLLLAYNSYLASYKVEINQNDPTKDAKLSTPDLQAALSCKPLEYAAESPRPFGDRQLYVMASPSTSLYAIPRVNFRYRSPQDDDKRSITFWTFKNWSAWKINPQPGDPIVDIDFKIYGYWLFTDNPRWPAGLRGELKKYFNQNLVIQQAAESAPQVSWMGRVCYHVGQILSPTIKPDGITLLGESAYSFVKQMPPSYYLEIMQPAKWKDPVFLNSIKVIDFKHDINELVLRFCQKPCFLNSSDSK